MSVYIWCPHWGDLVWKSYQNVEGLESRFDYSLCCHDGDSPLQELFKAERVLHRIKPDRSDASSQREAQQNYFAFFGVVGKAQTSSPEIENA